MPEEPWTEVHDIVQERGIKTISKNKKYKKAKYLSEEALQIAVKRYGHHQILNSEIRLIIFFAAKDGEALHNQQTQDLELTVVQIMY